MQGDLFTLSRRNSPTTSKEAAARVHPQLNVLQAEVLVYFEEYGPATDKEMCAQFKKWYSNRSESTWRTRRSELRDQGLIIACGKIEGCTTWKIKP